MDDRSILQRNHGSIDSVMELSTYFPEVAEAARMERVYEGLKVGAALSPRYIFLGKRRGYYERYHPNKKIKTIFVPGLGMRSYRPITGASPASYFVDATDGDDAQDGLSEGNAWKTISKVNSTTLVAADRVKLQRGEKWRGEEVDRPGPGSSGSPIVFEPYGTGAKPILDGSELITGWTAEGTTNVWEASFVPNDVNNPDTERVFFDDVTGVPKASIAALAVNNDWFYDGAVDKLYVYSSAGDPDTVFTSPGIEATSAEFLFELFDTGFIHIDSIDCKRANGDCIKDSGTTSGCEYKDLDLSEAAEGMGFMTGGTTTDAQLIRITCHDNGIDDVLNNGFYMVTATVGNGGWLMEDCISHDNKAIGFQLFNSPGGTMRRCLSYDNGGSGIIAQDSFDNANITMEYCVSHGNGKHGLTVVDNGLTYNGNNNIKYHNCVSYNNGQYGIFLKGNNDADTIAELKNCIALENAASSSFYTDLEFRAGQSATFTLDNNCYFRASGDMIFWDGTDYLQTQFATYQSASGQDANGISSDPLFINAAGADFHLKSNSPCIEAGAIIVGLTKDFDGIPLGRGTNPDMGAHETLKGGPRGI